MDRQRHIVIGLTGPFGAGCTTQVAGYLADSHQFKRYSLSDALRALAPSLVDDLDQQKLEPGQPMDEVRGYLQDVGNRIRSKRRDAMAQWVLDKVREDGCAGDIVIDSIKNPCEIAYFADRLPNFFVVAVYASQQTRWNRLRQSYRDHLAKFEEDDARESGEFESSLGQQVQLCVDQADILVSNDRDFTEPWIETDFREQQLKYYIKLMREPGGQPHPDELMMALAYSTSIMSTCCKRKVGAVLVEEDEKALRNFVVSSGYNEVPPQLKSCLQRGGGNPAYCVRDEQIRKTIQQYKRCHQCGAELPLMDVPSLPLRCPECSTLLSSKSFFPGRAHDICIAVHAEESAIVQAARVGGSSTIGKVLYTTTFPCTLCARKILQAGIRKVVFAEPYPDGTAIQMFLEAKEEAEIAVELFVGVKGRALHRLYEAPAKV